MYPSCIIVTPNWDVTRVDLDWVLYNTLYGIGICSLSFAAWSLSISGSLPTVHGLGFYHYVGSGYDFYIDVSNSIQGIGTANNLKTPSSSRTTSTGQPKFVTTVSLEHEL